MSQDVRNSNILIVGTEKFTRPLMTLLRNESFRSIEDFNKVDFVWTLIHAKKNIRPYHLVMFDLGADEVESNKLFVESRKDEYGANVPIVYVVNESNENQSIDPFCKVVKRPLETEKILNSVNELYKLAYPNGFKVIDIIEKDKHIIVRLPNDLAKSALEELNTQLEQYYTEHPEDLVVLSFQSITEIDRNQIRSLFQIILPFYKKKRKIASINLCKKVDHAIKQQGVESNFYIYPDYKNALKANGIEVSNTNSNFLSLNADLVNPFISLSLEKFKEVFDIEFKTQSPFKIKSEEFDHEVSAIVDLKINQFYFYIAFNFKKESLLKLITKTQKTEKGFDAEMMKQKLLSILAEVSELAVSQLKAQNYETSEPRIQIISQVDQLKSALKEALIIGIDLESNDGSSQLIIATK